MTPGRTSTTRRCLTLAAGLAAVIPTVDPIAPKPKVACLQEVDVVR